MFVVWRSEPVKGRAGCPFLAADAEGGPTWRRGLRCEHGGDARLAHTALLMRSARVDGKPRQGLVERLPTIRSCCIADPFHAAAWWCHLDELAASWTAGTWSGAMLAAFLRDETTIRAKLRGVVPIPPPAARRAFDERHSQAEREDDAARLVVQQRQERDRLWLAEEAVREEKRRREQALAIEQARERLRVTVADYQVLGINPLSPYEHARATWRLLVLKHADKTSDRHQEIQAAWNRIELAEERRRADLFPPPTV